MVKGEYYRWYDRPFIGKWIGWYYITIGVICIPIFLLAIFAIVFVCATPLLLLYVSALVVLSSIAIVALPGVTFTGTISLLFSATFAGFCCVCCGICNCPCCPRVVRKRKIQPTKKFRPQKKKTLKDADVKKQM
jgi:asparagine N-glycosylation enzyme membrane subunit Stt3